MARFHLFIQSIKRSAGRSATGAAAYRSGERIRDERTGELHNFSSRTDVRHAEIFLPSQFGAVSPEWAKDRATLWNSAEASEKRSNARVAREFQVALPTELNHLQRVALARSFARDIADRYTVAVDLAIHDPNPDRPESNNFHAHLLTTTREVTQAGLGAKIGLDMQAVTRAKLGLSTHSEEFTAVRERWANLTNSAFRDANVDARVDHRSLAAQGIDRQPLVHVPLEFYRMEKHGVPKDVAERLRSNYRARVAADREKSSEASTVTEPASAADAPKSVEEVRRQAVQEWLKMRSKEAERPRESEHQTEPELDREDDF